MACTVSGRIRMDSLVLPRLSNPDPRNGPFFTYAYEYKCIGFINNIYELLLSLTPFISQNITLWPLPTTSLSVFANVDSLSDPSKEILPAF